MSFIFGLDRRSQGGGNGGWQRQANGPPSQRQANGPPPQRQANGPPPQRQSNGPPPHQNLPPDQYYDQGPPPPRQGINKAPPPQNNQWKGTPPQRPINNRAPVRNQFSSITSQCWYWYLCGMPYLQCMLNSRWSSMSLAPHRKLAEANSLPHQVDLNAPLIDWLIPSLGLLCKYFLYSGKQRGRTEGITCIKNRFKYRP